MASIVISGDTSGAVTLQAPAEAGTTTLTLPTTSGTLAVTSGSPSFTNLAYTGTLTGGTGVVNLGSGQFYKDTSGNVGIGTSSPLGRLHVASSGLTTLYISTTDEAADQKNWAFQYGTAVGSGTFRLRALNDANNSGQNAYIITRTATNVDTQQWLTSGTERMRIDSSGNVILSPSTSKIIGGDSTGRMVVTNSDQTTYGIFYGNTHATSPNIITFVTNSTKVTTINTTGNLVLTGGTATANGVGVTFPATQSASTDANCLDDYEEGTWTPSFSVASGSATYTNQQGTYTKIGRQVTVVFYITVNTSSSLVANGIAGLPFTGSSTNYAGTIFSVWSGIGGYCNVLGLTGVSNAIQIRSTNSATSPPVLNSLTVSNGAEIAGTLTYFVA